MPSSPKPAQEFVPVREVRDGIVVLKDNSMRAVLLTSSLNFALKSEDMQQATIFQFQNLLNSLDFSLQIFIQSRRLDIRPYIALLESRYKEQTTDLMKIQTREYIDFIKTFTENTNIMSKSFFTVVPYSSTPISTKIGPLRNVLKSISGKKNESGDDSFEENRTQLEQRIAVVEQGLLRTGIRVARLGTEEVVELFYKLFNPGATERPIQTGWYKSTN